MQNDTGRFERNALGVTRVSVTAGDGVTNEFTFEGSVIVAGVEKVPEYEGAQVASALHAQGTAGGLIFAMALVLETLERQHGVPPVIALPQAMMDMTALRKAMERPDAVERLHNEDVSTGVRVPQESHKDDLLRRLRRLSSGGDVHEA